MTAAGPGRVLVVAAAVVDDLAVPRRLLAARRSTPAELAGRWELPGGKVEPGEDPRDALHRELTEELAVSVVLGAELVGPVAGCWPISTRLEMRIWWAAVSAGTPTPTGSHDRLTWVRAADWHTLPWLDADRAPVVAASRLMCAS